MQSLIAKNSGLVSSKCLKIGSLYADFFRLTLYLFEHCTFLSKKLPSVHLVYQKMAIDFVSKYQPKFILKTDLWNEAETSYPIASMFSNICSIELDPHRVEKAKRMFPKMKCVTGDVKKLPFDDNTFSAILEFSTIDHIEDVKEVLFEYSRVLNSNGIMLLVVWLKSGKQKKMVKKFGDDTLIQMYFDDAFFVDAISSKFDIQEEGFFMQNAGIRYLAWFVLKKRSA